MFKIKQLNKFGVFALFIIRLAGVVAAWSAAAVWAQQGVAFVINSNDYTVSLIDTRAYKEISRKRVGREPHHVMATPDDKSLIIASVQSNDLMFFDPVTGALQKRIDKISDPYQLGFSPDRKWFVTASLALDRVDIYSADYKLVKRLPAPRNPSHMTFSADNRHVIVTLQDTDAVMVIDLIAQAVKATYPIGKTPAGICMAPDDKHIFVGLLGEDNVAVMDWRSGKMIRNIITATGAHNCMPMGDKRRLLVSNRVANSVSIIDMNTLSVLETFKAPGGPDDMELTADGKELWVTSRWINKVTVIDMQTKKIKTQVPVGRSPHGLYFHHHAPRL